MKLTDHGREIHSHIYDCIPETRRPKVEVSTDEEGFTSFQLWELMEIFGSYIGLGKKMCFEASIIMPRPNADGLK